MGKVIAHACLAAITFMLGIAYGLSTITSHGYQTPTTMTAGSASLSPNG